MDDTLLVSSHEERVLGLGRPKRVIDCLRDMPAEVAGPAQVMDMSTPPSRIVDREKAAIAVMGGCATCRWERREASTPVTDERSPSLEGPLGGVGSVGFEIHGSSFILGRGPGR